MQKKELYDNFYSLGLHPDMWLKWQGKPLILGDKNGLLPDSSPLPAEIVNFFTWRYSWYESTGHHQWPWLELYPQSGGYDIPGVPEYIPVGLATHPTGNIG